MRSQDTPRWPPDAEDLEDVVHAEGFQYEGRKMNKNDGTGAPPMA